MKKNVLIISFTFPPMPGIGGRRWAKFAKYLDKQGHQVTILSAKNIFQESSNWLRDVEGLDLVYLPYRYPEILSKKVSNVFQKILYRLSLLFVKVMDKGNYYDKSIFWKDQLHKKVKELVAIKKIDTIIVTGAPFRLVYYTTLLKMEFPDIQFISDFRDMWTQDSELSAMSGLSEKRKCVEKQFERVAVENSDKVLMVSERMFAYFSTLTDSSKCFLIPNGFDPLEFSHLQNMIHENELSRKKISIIFAGTVYNNLNYILEPFFLAIEHLKKESPDLYGLLSVTFYGKFPLQYKSFINDLHIDDCVLIKGEQPYQIVSTAIERAHYGLLFLNDIYNDSFSTKFCEYLGQKKKVLVVSRKGITSDFVIQNELGYHIDPNNSYKELLNCLNKVYENDFKIQTNEHFNTDYFAIDKIALKLEQLL